MDELVEYLRSRHVSEEDIQRMEQHKIDSSVIQLMTDDQLREYLPSHSDRVAVLGYCRRKGKGSSRCKSKIFERLRGKLTRNKVGHVPDKEHQALPKNAQKNERKIEMGWMHFREGTFVQVGTKKGGGTRKVSVQKDFGKQNLIETAVQLFFPGGKNAEGSRSDFDIDLTDFQQHPLEDNITVGELYEKIKSPLLRFYLTSKKRDVASAINQMEDTTTHTTTQEGEKSHDQPDVYHQSPDTSVTDVEISSSDVIHVASNTVFANTSGESVSLLHAPVNPTDDLPEQEMFLHVDTLEDSGIGTPRTESFSGVEHSSLDDALPLTEELWFEDPLRPSME